MRVDVLGQFLLLPGGQPSAQLRVGDRTAVIHANELVRQGDAERVHIDALGSAWMLELRLELQRGRPNVAVEEEQSGPEVDLGKAELGEQRAGGIYIDERAAQQAARFLPAVEAAARRDERHLAIPLAAARPRQA